jgi:hypothetical protein
MGVILRGLFGNDAVSPMLARIFGVDAALTGTAAFCCLCLAFFEWILHPRGLIEGHVLLNLHEGFIL